MDDIGDRIRRKRLERGWDIDKLAYLADLSSSGLGKLERGCYSPTLTTLAKIAGALEISVMELLAEAEDELPVRELLPAAA